MFKTLKACGPQNEVAEINSYISNNFHTNLKSSYKYKYEIIDTRFSETFITNATIYDIVSEIIKIYEKRKLNVSNAVCRLLKQFEDRNPFYHRTHTIKLCRNNNIDIDKYLK